MCARLNYVRKLPDVDRHDSDTLCGAPSEPVMFHFGPATILMEPNRGSIEARGGGLYPPVRNIDSLCEHLRETFTGSIDRWTMTEDLFPPSSLPPFLLSPTPPSCRFVAGIRNKFEREFKVRVNSFIRNGGKGA